MVKFGIKRFVDVKVIRAQTRAAICALFVVKAHFGMKPHVSVKTMILRRYLHLPLAFKMRCASRVNHGTLNPALVSQLPEVTQLIGKNQI